MSTIKTYFCNKMSKSVRAEGSYVSIVIKAEKTVAIFYKTNSVDAYVDNVDFIDKKVFYGTC